MRRKYIYYFSMFLFAAMIMILHPAITDETRFTRNTTRTRWIATGALSGEPVETPYYILFTPERHAVGNISYYLPKYAPTDAGTARMYAALFRMSETCEEDEEAFLYTDGMRKLTVYKHTRQLRYESSANDANVSALVEKYTDDDHGTDKYPMDEYAAIEHASEFLHTYMPMSQWEEARVSFDGLYYTVTFVDRIGNIKNYAFNNTVKLDVNGCVLQVDYFFIQYERLGACRIKSERDALAELPSDLPADVYVYLTDAQLVYTYENSIIQPAYFFEGDQSGGEKFEHFIKAAVYGP